MTKDANGSPEFPERVRGFATTHWSLVLLAGDSAAEGSRDALSALCGSYWYPLYAFARRWGHRPADAQDLTQAFFSRLLEKQDLAGVDRNKGKFRSFLLTSLRHFLLNEWDKDHAMKRGGACTRLSLDFNVAESKYSLEPSHQETAEAIFDREWALALLDKARLRLTAEQQSEQKQRQLEVLQIYLTAAPDPQSYRLAGETLGMAENSVKVAVHRLRRQFRDILRDEIRHTVATEEEVDEEVRSLFAALRR